MSPRTSAVTLPGQCASGPVGCPCTRPRDPAVTGAAQLMVGEVPIQRIKMSHGRGRHRQAGNRGYLSGKDRLDTGQSESPEQGQSWGFMGTTARGLLWVRAEVHHQEGTAGRAGAWVWQAGDCVSVEPGRGGPSTLVRVRMLMAVFGSGADHTLSTQTL